jgi:hypothetical protein
LPVITAAEGEPGTATRIIANWDAIAEVGITAVTVVIDPLGLVTT